MVKLNKMSKQTAVEFLEKELIKRGCLRKGFIIPDKVFEQAKEMERSQIIDADLNGSFRTSKGFGGKLSSLRIKELAEQYYNETYKKEQ